MNHQANNPPSDLSAINDRVTRAVRSHEIKIRVLSTAALLFGFLALATSLALAGGYFIKIRPKLNQLMMMQDSQAFMRQSTSNPVAEPLTAEEVPAQIDRLSRDNAHLTVVVMVVSAGTAVMALAVGTLGLGTLVLLLVVVLSRRVALNQLNASLAEISHQLRIRGSPPVEDRQSQDHPTLKGP